MAPASLIPQASLRATDWFLVGLFLCLAGGFLLANAVIVLSPGTRGLERLQGAATELRALRDAVFFRVQVSAGFLFLLSGFALQIYGRFSGNESAAEFPVFAAGGVVLAVVVLEVAAWWIAHALFRRSLREHFLRHPPDFETDIALAREVGGLFDMQPRSDEAVPSYVERLRRALGLPAPGRRERPRGGTVPAVPPVDGDEDLVP